MTLRLANPSVRGATSAASSSDSALLSCAVVNNMPDGAFDATERQYLGLLEDGSGPHIVEVRRFTVPGVPRGEQTTKRIAEEYFPLPELYADPPDVLIVTGSNPIELRLENEPYWTDLVELLSWARLHVRSVVLSCLAAHAALAIFDGAERVHLSAKCTGVFSQCVEEGEALTAGIDAQIPLPHSRWNTVSSEAVERAGFKILVHSESTGWGIAARREFGRELILVQGHPEYDPSSLLREYRRDAGRFVRHERDEAPCLPYHCVSPEDWSQLEQVHHEMIQTRNPRIFEEYPFGEVGERAPWSWRPMAERFYENWLTSVIEGGE